jgi:hypothetical protein
MGNSKDEHFDIEAMGIKTIVRFHLRPVRMTIIKNTTNVGEEVGKKEPSHIVGRNVNQYSY